MNILFISPEVFPFAKTGGLADVAGALPEALNQRGHKCSIILPLYRCVLDKFSPHIFKKKIPVRLHSREDFFNLRVLEYRDIKVYFVEKERYYNRRYLYGTPHGDYSDNALRFGFFAKCVVASIPYIGKQDILHCNDWQTALIPLYVKLFYKDEEEFSNTRCVFSIHNMAYQGIFKKNVLKRLGLPQSLFTSNTLEFYGKINFMKAGIIYADAISTVSKGYSREILTPEFGCGLDGLLRTRQQDLYGIINGVDYSIWDPAIDRYIVKNYDRNNLTGKVECKKDVLKEFGMGYDLDRPLVSMITRLAEQKGVDLVADSMEEMLDSNVNFVLLGTGDERYHKIFSTLAQRYRGRVGVRLGFDNSLAHRIEAGADIFLMPSRYEPCGLNQLYSLKYATVPVVRAVGGLDDTVEEFDPITKKGNGFKFKEASKEGLIGAIRRAVDVFKERELWDILLQNGLACDYSWNASAEKYEALYKRLLT